MMELILKIFRSYQVPIENLCNDLRGFGIEERDFSSVIKEIINLLKDVK